MQVLRIPLTPGRDIADEYYVRVLQKIHFRHFDHPSLFFARVKSAKYGLDFLLHTPLNRPHFETEQNIGDLKVGSADDWLTSSTNWSNWSNLVHSTLKTSGSLGALRKTYRENLLNH